MGNEELPVFIMETWEHEQIFQGNLGVKWILGAVWNFFWGNSQKAFLGISEILEIFLGNTEIQTPWGAS